MVGTGSPVSFRRRYSLLTPGVCLPRPAKPRVWAHVQGRCATRGSEDDARAPTGRALSRFPRHKSSTEAGTLKDGGNTRRASRGACCVRPSSTRSGLVFGVRLPCVVLRFPVIPQRSLRAEFRICTADGSHSPRYCSHSVPDTPVSCPHVNPLFHVGALAPRLEGLRADERNRGVRNSGACT